MSILLRAAAVALLGACTAAPPGSGDILEAGGKADTTSGMELVRVIDDTQHIAGYYVSTFVAETPDRETIRVESPLLYLVPPRVNNFISIDMTYQGSLFTRTAFQLFHTASTGEPSPDPDDWQRLRCVDDEGPVNYFSRVVIDNARREVVVGALLTTYSFEQCGISGEIFDPVIGLFPFPVSTWSSLAGTYEYAVSLICDGVHCG